MSLPSENLSKLNKFALLEGKLPAPTVKIEPMVGGNAFSDEEITYRKIIDINPLFKELVNDLDLVSSLTGEQIRKADILYQLKIVETVSSHQLQFIARSIMIEKESYTKEQVISRLSVAVKVDRQRAKNVFYMMLDVGIIKATLERMFCLADSVLMDKIH